MKEAELMTFVLRSSTYTARRSKGWGADQQIDKTKQNSDLGFLRAPSQSATPWNPTRETCSVEGKK
jgi:hypothetical protein